MVSVRVMGPLELLDQHEQPVAIGSALQRRLIAALVLHRGAPVPADVLADAIWGDDLPTNPANAVQTHVARVRRLLPDGVEVVTEPRGYRLEVPLGTLDVNRFDRLLTEAEVEVDAARRSELLGAALALWRGDPYAELDHPSARPEIARLCEARLNAVERQAEALQRAGQLPAAVALLEGLVVEAPLREAPVALLMRCLVGAGRQSDALRAYGRLRTALAEELGIDPSAGLRQLEEQVLRQELDVEAVTPIEALRPARTSARHLPLGLPASSFVGRDDELSSVLELLATQRIVTLRGPGGVGKTRLARHVLAASVDDFTRVTVVDLTTVRLAERVREAVAVALQLELSGDQDLDDRIRGVLSIGRQLLVIDCCEHLVDEVAMFVEETVTQSPSVHVLATSREALRIDGEHVIPLGPLPAASAHRLFVDRMVAAGEPAPDDEGHRLVDEVCQRLDLLPLAIELAAARAPTLGLAGLLDGLDQRFDLLRSGRRTGAPHHRSLRDVVEWSDALLADEERLAFHRFSVFAGGVELDHAVEVLADHALPPARVRAILPDLVDRSLVATSTTTGATSYRLLDTLRDFGRERLREDPTALRGRFTDWALRLAARATEGQQTRWESEWARRLDVHLADLLQAHRWLGEAGDVGGQLAITAVLGRHAMYRYRLDVARLVERTIGEHGDRLDPNLPEILGCAGTLAWQRGRFDDAAELGRRAIEVAEALEEPLRARFGHDVLSNVAMFRGDADNARRHGEQLVVLAGEAEDHAIQMTGYIDLVLAEFYSGDDAAADIVEERASELAHELDGALWLGWLAYVQGERRIETDPGFAIPRLREAIRQAEVTDCRFLANVARHTLVTHASRSGPADEAVRSFGPLIDHWYRTGAWNQLWMAIRALIAALARLGAHHEAALLLGANDASPVAPSLFGADAARIDRVRTELEASLGDSYEVAMAKGSALGDERAVAIAVEIIART